MGNAGRGHGDGRLYPIAGDAVLAAEAAVDGAASTLARVFPTALPLF